MTYLCPWMMTTETRPCAPGPSFHECSDWRWDRSQPLPHDRWLLKKSPLSSILMRRSVEVLHFLVETVSPPGMAQLHGMSHQPFSALTHAPSPNVHKSPSSATFQELWSRLQDAPGLDGNHHHHRITTAAALAAGSNGNLGNHGEAGSYRCQAKLKSTRFSKRCQECDVSIRASWLKLAWPRQALTATGFRNPADFVDHPK